MSTPFNIENPFFRKPDKADRDYHVNSDVDSSTISKHHTLGPRRNQASPGNHLHLGTDGSLAGARVVKGNYWTGSTTDVTSASTTFVEHSSFSISSVPLTLGVMYLFVAQIAWFKSGGTSTASNAVQFKITQNTVGGTAYSPGTFVQYIWAAESGSENILNLTIPWLHTLASSVDNVIFSFNRQNGDGSIGVRATTGRTYAWVEAMGQNDTRMSVRTT